MRNRERYSSMISSVRVGRCAMSTCTTSSARAGHYLPATVVVRPQGSPRDEDSLEGDEQDPNLLRVQLDDQLLLDLSVDDLTLGQGVDQDAHPRRDDFQPGRNRLVAEL